MNSATVQAAAPADGVAAAPSLDQRIGELLTLAESQPGPREAAAALRAQLAPRRVVVVDAWDLRHEKPAAVGRRFKLYYASSDGHCWQVSEHGAQAAGLLLCAAA